MPQAFIKHLNQFIVFWIVKSNEYQFTYAKNQEFSFKISRKYQKNQKEILVDTQKIIWYTHWNNSKSMSRVRIENCFAFQFAMYIQDIISKLSLISFSSLYVITEAVSPRYIFVFPSSRVPYVLLMWTLFFRFDLGHLQGSKERVDDVILPNWATSAEDFIFKHRKALVSHFSSSFWSSFCSILFVPMWWITKYTEGLTVQYQFKTMHMSHKKYHGNVFFVSSLVKFFWKLL